jgi:hypothetical protein
MAMGTGKTLVGMAAAARLLPGGGTVAVLVPSLVLVFQTLRAWQQAAWDLNVLAVCAADDPGDISTARARCPRTARRSSNPSQAGAGSGGAAELIGRGPGGPRLCCLETVRQDEEVVPMNVSTWVLLCGVTVGR